MLKASLLIIAIVALFASHGHAQSTWKPQQEEQLDLKRTLVAQSRTTNGKTTILLLIPTWQQEQVTTQQPRRIMTTETRVRTETKNDGTQVEVPYTVQVPVETIVDKVIAISKPQAQKRVDLPIDNVKAWNLNGQQLDDMSIVEILREPKHVLALPEGVKQYKPDPYYNFILQPKTIVLAVSKTAFPASERIARPAVAANRSSTNTTATDENIVIDQTNKERAKAGLPPLKRSEQLMESARKHSRNMAAKRTLAHELGGTNFLTRAQAEGYRFAGGGENIAEGARSSLEVVSMWMQSPGHRSNILDANYTEIGVGFAFDANGRRFDTQVFGRPEAKSLVE